MLNKIKKSISELMKTQKQYFIQYKATFILLLITTLIALVTATEENLIQKQIIILVFSDILIFTIENMFTDNKKKIIGYLLSAFLAIISYYFLFEKTPTYNVIIFFIGFYSISILTSIYLISKKIDFSDYLLQFFQNQIIYEIIMLILQVGTIFIITIINLLLLSNINEMLYVRAEILLMGLAVVPGSILSFVNINTINTNFTQKLIKFIILPLVLISEFVIYLYFIKVIITFQIPNNEIYRIIACLFIAAYPTWTMLETNNNEKITRKISKYLTYSFIPLILLQTYSIGIRILQNGITITRYFGIIYLVFEIAAIIISIHCKKRKSLILIIMEILVFISTMIPYMNIIDLSYYSQLNRMKKIFPIKESFHKLSNREQKQLASSYQYIKYTLDLEDRLPEYMKESSKEWDNYDPWSNYNKEKTIDYYKDKININIKDYSQLKEISISYYQNQEIEKIKIKELQKEEWQKSFQKQIKKYIEQENINNSWIKLDNNTSIYITYAYLTYQDNTIHSITIEGYLLTK